MKLRPDASEVASHLTTHATSCAVIGPKKRKRKDKRKNMPDCGVGNNLFSFLFISANGHFIRSST